MMVDAKVDVSCNALYSGCLTSPWPKVIAALNNEIDITPVYVVGENDGVVSLAEQFENCFFHSLSEAWSGQGFPDLDYRYSLDDSLLKSIAYEQLLTLSMMDRLDLTSNGFLFADRQHYFYFLLKRWLVIIREFEIELIISPAVPHRIFDYVLYIAAKISGVKFLMFQMTPFRDASFLIDDIDHTSKMMKHSLKKAGKQAVLRKDIRNRIEAVSKKYEDAMPDYMVVQKYALNQNLIKRRFLPTVSKVMKEPLKLFSIFKSSPHRYTTRSAMPYDTKDKRYVTLIDRHRNRRFMYHLKQAYESLADESPLPQNYVLVALHYQPEETANPTGGIFSNQELIVEMLHAFLDDNITIMIKEHSTQFHSEYEGALGRSRHFYRNLTEISARVRFVPTDTDPFTLIDGAKATVTISGTIGWESVIRGTPAFVFGRAWYEDMPGVYKIRTGADLEKAWWSAVESRERISLEDIYEYHAKLQSFFIEAPHNLTFLGKSQRSVDESAGNIVEGIKRYFQETEMISGKKKRGKIDA